MPASEIDQLLVRFVSAVDLFRKIDLDDVAALLRQSTRMDFESGETIFLEGDEGHAMYIVTKGAFEVYRNVAGQHVYIASIEPGEHFGEIALLMNRPRSASVRAIQPGSVIRLTKQAIMNEHRAAALLFQNMARQMAQRLVSVDNEVILHKTGKYPAFRPEASASPSAQDEYVVVKRS
ncbi:MAG TPA: cyclic nucleotide-binding domain-containing protein [Gallionella sp.]|nr:cyclic nucleotide-binding domain-containing protein [Gallionella sp.]